MSSLNDWPRELRALCQKVGKPTFETYVMKACQTGRAFLFCVEDGWVVVEPRLASTPHLFVLAAYCTGRDAIQRYEPTLMRLAHTAGLSTLRFEAARKGYARLMPARGWRLLADGVTWEKSHGRR